MKLLAWFRRDKQAAHASPSVVPSMLTRTVTHAGQTVLKFGYYTLSRMLFGLAVGSTISMVASVFLWPLWWNFSQWSMLGRIGLVLVQLFLVALPWLWAMWSYRHGLLVGASKALAMQQQPMLNWLLSPLVNSAPDADAQTLATRMCQLDAALPRAQRLLAALIVAQLDRPALFQALNDPGIKQPRTATDASAADPSIDPTQTSRMASAQVTLNQALAEQIEARWLQADHAWILWLALAHAGIAAIAIIGLHRLLPTL